jgi:glycosyltransferase involved in cell wall biosynthesis
MKKENYIPFSKEILLEKQLEQSYTNETDANNFKRLFHILEHYFHYEGFGLNQQLKLNYAHFDPDRLPEERVLYANKSNLNTFHAIFKKVLEHGNFEQIDEEVLQKAINASDLVGLNLHIDFDDYNEYYLYARGLTKTKEQVKRFFFWKKEVEIEYYDRVVIYLHYKDSAYFKAKQLDPEKLHFVPNSIVLKIFKRVPKNDLETIFPNAVPKMSLKDKLLLWIPAIGGGVPILSTKVVPALMKLGAAYKGGNLLDLKGLKTTLLQSGIALVVLGLYLFRQYKGYQNKKNNFQKMLTDSLYFKNLGNNGGVFHSLIDASEEEEMKETMLAYSFLLQNNQPTNAEVLDQQIESWFVKEFNCELDFDVHDALSKLQHIGLAKEQNSTWTVLPMEKALKRVDEIWDGIFEYNK